MFDIVTSINKNLSDKEKKIKSTMHYPPIAGRTRSASEYHGYTLSDYYSWMREKKSRNVKNYLRAENDYTHKMMAPSEGLQKKLYSEIVPKTVDEYLSLVEKYPQQKEKDKLQIQQQL